MMNEICLLIFEYLMISELSLRSITPSNVQGSGFESPHLPVARRFPN